MSNNEIIIIAIRDYYEIKINQEKNRAYIKLSDYWKYTSEASEYIEHIISGVQKLTKGFTVLVDMIEYNGTSSDLHHLHVEAQRISVEAGVSRFAEVFNNNPILKTFSDIYSKESGAITMAFHDKTHAERWLDLY